MFIIGERINGMYKDVRRAIKNRDKGVIQNLAKLQIEAGAQALDVNVGPASSQPTEAIKWLIEVIQEEVDVPLALDSTKPEVIKEGLKLVKNKAIINSTSADKERLDILIPLAKEYKASLIALTMDKKGIPRDSSQRCELAAQIVTTFLEAGLSIEDLYLDPIILPVNVAQPQVKEVLSSLREFKLLYSPPPKTIIGLSNVSQGTKNRSLINRTFLVMACACGLDSAILDPLDKELKSVLITAELLLNKIIYCDSYLDACK